MYYKRINSNNKIQSLILGLLVFSCSYSFAVDSLKSTQAVQTLSQLIKFRSYSGHEKEAGEYLLQQCSKSGLEIHVFNNYDSAFNFSASLYPLELQKPNIVFLCHLDVVPASDSVEWRFPPFSGRIKDDTIWGRGCLDMKGVGVMQIQAVTSYIAIAKMNSLPYNFTVLFVSGEETGGLNGANLIVENNLSLLNAELVIGEGGAGLKGALPANPNKQLFFLSVAEKKSLWLKLTVHQKTHGHSSLPSSNSANSMMIRAIDRITNEKPIITFNKTTKQMFENLGELNGGLSGFVLKHINSFLLRPFRRKILNSQPLLITEVTNTVQLTNYSNPYGPPNVIPGSAVSYFDCRLVPTVSSDKFIRKLKLRIRNPKVEIEVVDQSPYGKASKLDEKYYAIESALKKIYPDCAVLPVLFPATTDNSYFRSKGIKSYGLLPLELNTQIIESVHSVNECIPVSTFLKGIDAYKMIIKEIINSK